MNDSEQVELVLASHDNNVEKLEDDPEVQRTTTKLTSKCLHLRLSWCWYLVNTSYRFDILEYTMYSFC